MHVRVGQMGPQQLDPIGTNSVDAKVKLLDGCKVGQVGPQRFDTISTNVVAAEVKLLDAREGGPDGSPAT